MLHFVIFLKGNKLELNKKGFDNLANNEKAEQQKKEQGEMQDDGKNQEDAKTPEKTTSCDHPGQCAEAESKENQDKDGKMAAVLLLSYRFRCKCDQISPETVNGIRPL